VSDGDTEKMLVGQAVIRFPGTALSSSTRTAGGLLGASASAESVASANAGATVDASRTTSSAIVERGILASLQSTIRFMFARLPAFHERRRVSRPP